VRCRRTRCERGTGPSGRAEGARGRWRHRRADRGRLARTRRPRVGRPRDMDAALLGRATVVVEDVATAPRGAGDVVLAIAEGALTLPTWCPCATSWRHRDPAGRSAVGLQERRDVLAGLRRRGSRRAHGSGRLSLNGAPPPSVLGPCPGRAAAAWMRVSAIGRCMTPRAEAKSPNRSRSWVDITMTGLRHGAQRGRLVGGRTAGSL